MVKNNKMSRIFSFFILLLMSASLFAQPPKKGFEPEDAQEHMDHNNFLMALKVYKELLKKEPQNMEFNYKTAICYLSTNLDKKAAIPYLENVTKQPKCPTEAWFDLGRAYHYGNRFDDAIKAFNKYKEKDKKGAERADRQIEMCNNGKQLIRYPVQVTFENLGKEINTEFPDYYPFVPADESFLVFTSRRKESMGGQLEIDGYYPSDIFIATSKTGVWTKAKNMGAAINTRYDEEAVSLSADGKTMIVYLDHIDSLGNIYMTENKKGSWGKIAKLDKNVNAEFENSGSIAPDGQTIFFASDRPGTFGETDLYMARKLPNGKWGMPQNLGNEINSKYKEEHPVMAPDGRTLYFSSQGHSSMGDFDLFKAIWDPENNTWSAPKNLGYPLSTSGDDRCISFAQDDKIAYLSATRDGGFGDLDIYRVKFSSEEAARYTVVRGRVVTPDSLNPNIKVDAIITATDTKTKEEFTFTPIPKTGKYVMALPPGKYNITIEASGYKQYIDALVLFDLGGFQPEVVRNFQLMK